MNQEIGLDQPVEGASRMENGHNIGICIEIRQDWDADPKISKKSEIGEADKPKEKIIKIGPKLITNGYDYLKNKGLNTEALSEIELNQQKNSTTCTVCYELVQQNDIIEFDGASHDICKSCFVEYLTTQINNNKVLKISCPHCSQELLENTIKQVIPEELYQKYQRFLNNLRINLDPLRKWCPNPRCSREIILNETLSAKGKCPHCGLSICEKCGQDHNAKISCEQHVAQEVKKWKLKNHAGACPKCKILSEKVSGCHHMTCP